MARFTPESDEYQRKRWMRPDAERYWRPDAARWMTPEAARLLLPDSMQPERKDDSVAPLLSASRAEREREERMRRQDILRLKSQIAALRFQRALILHMMALQRATKFNPDQPRVPAGNPDGGQWTSGGGGEGINDSRVISDETPDNLKPGAQYAELKRPGIGHNNPPPDVPEKRPPTAQERHRIAREVARRPGLIGALLAAREWLRELGPSIDSYNDPPKSFEELQQAASEKPKLGYNDHHIVLQASQ